MVVYLKQTLINYQLEYVDSYLHTELYMKPTLGMI